MANFEKLPEDCTYKYIPECGEWHGILPSMQKDFEEHGYVIVKNLYSKAEVDKIVEATEKSEAFQKALYGLTDKENLKYYMNLWTEPGNDVLGMANKVQKMRETSEKISAFIEDSYFKVLNKGEIYLFGAKIIMKHANAGAAFLWHQDYGYWYNNGCIWPDMMSTFVALTKNDEENGGLEVFF